MHCSRKVLAAVEVEVEAGVVVGVEEVDDPVGVITAWVTLYTLLDGDSLDCVEAQYSMDSRVVFCKGHYSSSWKTQQTAQEVVVVVIVVVVLVGEFASQVPACSRAGVSGGFGYGRLFLM